MPNETYKSRVKRIEARAQRGNGPELLSGVGNVRETRVDVDGNSLYIKPKASIFLALFGAGVGFGAFKVLRDMIGINEIFAFPPNMLLEIAMSEPIIGAAGVVLMFCALLCVVSLMRGRKAASSMSFSCGAVGAALGGFLMATL